MTEINWLATPFPVEITNHTEWWVQWLPFFGSGLLFIASMITLWLTNWAASRRLAKELERQGIRHKSEMNALDRPARLKLRRRGNAIHGTGGVTSYFVSGSTSSNVQLTDVRRSARKQEAGSH